MIIPIANEPFGHKSQPYHAWLHALLTFVLCWRFGLMLRYAMPIDFVLGVLYELIWDCWLVKYWRKLRGKEPKVNGFSFYDIVFNEFGQLTQAFALAAGGWPI